MDIKVTVQAENQVVEEYVVPPGTWLQSRTMGAIPVSDTHVPQQFTMGRCSWQGRTVRPLITLTPIHPPTIPEPLLELVTGKDKRWGHEGYEWMGCERDSAGGTPLQRARAYVQKYDAGWSQDLPVELTEQEMDALLEKTPPALPPQKGESQPLARMLEDIEALAEGSFRKDLGEKVKGKMAAMAQPDETDAVFAVIADIAAEALREMGQTP